ncbi:HpcH/HpaI aldolase/citrate lyase family protein [Nostoc sp. CHAB 5784]|uniref:HpcH/HpaI aldolase/citrate lyase family protein n=1 Tax=Nostoc mirabile TaxID=2907820 RepID=UPI001E40F498|nr:aldolase/citrate lyase family protein [Nostoc mirabile]MCC5669476.1 HpcH/HpaI aldolase/citrate lyase family protein [Nostoc mirabile CHAB5784]
MALSVTGRAIPRSVLYTSALDPQRLAKALQYDSDLHLIDLEDSVPQLKKEYARTLCRDALMAAPVPQLMAVRINPMHSAEVYRDLVMLLDASSIRPGFLFMTMVETESEVDCLRRSLAEVNWQPQIYATIETVAAIQNIVTLVTKLDGMILGSADLAATLGVPISQSALRSARQAMALAAAGAGIGCLDTGNFHLNEPELLEAEITEAKAMGFHGKGTVHPKELPAINAVFRPDQEEAFQAMRIIEASEAAAEGVCILNGSMIGPPFIRRAKQLLADNLTWQSFFRKTTTEVRR